MSTCLLAVDTATEICGVALAMDGRVIAELSLDLGVTHTQCVMNAIDTVLAMKRMDISAVDRFAVTRGPGSFTGLRIGISTVKGLAHATGKPMVGVSCLEILAHQAPADAGLICSMMDARRNEVYWALYGRQEDGLRPIIEENVALPATVAENIDQPCFFIGNGIAQYQKKIGESLTQPAQWANCELNAMRPAVLARLAWQRFSCGLIDSAQTLVPVYLRKSDAELPRKALTAG